MMRRLAMLLLVPWMALAGGGYDSMTSDQLRAELAKVQARLQAAAQAGKKQEALALGEELKKVAKAYGESFRRAAPKPPVAPPAARPAAPPGRSGGTPASPGGGAAGATPRQGLAGRWDHISALIRAGEIERGLNLMEGLADEVLAQRDAGMVSAQNAGMAITLAGYYLEIVRDASRAKELAEKAEAFCDHHLGESPDWTDLQVRTWLAIRQGARAQLSSALAQLGASRELQALAEESADRWEALRAASMAGKTPPYSEVDQAFLYGGATTLAIQLMRAGDALTRRRSQADEAKAQYRRSLAILEAYRTTVPRPEGPMAHIRVARLGLCRALEGYLRRQLGDLEASRAAYEETFTWIRRYRELQPQAPDFWVYARPRMEYAELLAVQGEFEAALQAVQAAHAEFRSLKKQGYGNEAFVAQAWRPYVLEAEIREREGDDAAAIAAYRQAVEELEGFYASMRSGQLKGAFLEFEECRRAYQRLVALLVSAGRTAEALSYLERSKSAVLLDMLRSLPLRRRENWPEELLVEERKIKEKLQRLRRDEGGEAAPSETRAAEVGELSELHWEYEVLLRKVAEEVQEEPEVAKPEGFESVWYRSPDELTAASASRGGRLVVTYFDDGEVVRAFALRGGELTVHECGKTRKLERATSKLRRNIASRSRRWARPARDLFEALVDPWLARLEGAAELVVVPTGFLYALPFACLAPEDGAPLAARVPLSVTSQASLVADAPDELEVPAPRLVVGDPDGSLPSARDEARAIAAACPDPEACHLLVGEEARESILKDRLGHTRSGVAPGVVHLATHGLLERGRELFSSLVLAPDALEDGTLSVAEVFSDLDLLETPVVVLSACNTALGAEGGGDEIVGLSRAFQYAGARWVVASLWEVSDEASAFLMKELHQGLAETGRVDVALARAMEKTRGEREEWAHPYYWAPFAAFRR